MPHSWQAPSSHLWRATSVILTVREPLNWTLLQYNRTYNPVSAVSHFFASVLTRVAKVQLEAARDLLFEPKRSRGVEHLITNLLYAAKPALSSSITSQRYSLAIMLLALFAPIPVYALNSFRPVPLSSHFAVFHPYCVLVIPLTDTMTSVFHFKLFFRSPRPVSRTRRATISTTSRASTDLRYATTRPRS